MKPYKLNIKVVIAGVGVFSLIIFSLALVIFHVARMENVGEILLEYGYIIAPASILWILIDKYLWHTKLFQSIKSPLNIPPDIRGRWEGILENSNGDEPQKFIVEVRQTLTDLHVDSFSSIGHSASILAEIATSHNEDKFTLCYLWQGEMNTSIKELHPNEAFHGYTMLNFHEHENPRILKGWYFTNRRSGQTRGGIQLEWVSYIIKHKLD